MKRCTNSWPHYLPATSVGAKRAMPRVELVGVGQAAVDEVEEEHDSHHHREEVADQGSAGHAARKTTCHMSVRTKKPMYRHSSSQTSRPASSESGTDPAR